MTSRWIGAALALLLAAGSADASPTYDPTQPLTLGTTYVWSGRATNRNRPITTRWRWALTPLCANEGCTEGVGCATAVCADDPRVATTAACGETPLHALPGGCVTATITCRGAACPCRQVVVGSTHDWFFAWSCGGQQCSSQIHYPVVAPYHAGGYVVCTRDRDDLTRINVDLNLRYRGTR